MRALSEKITKKPATDELIAEMIEQRHATPDSMEDLALKSQLQLEGAAESLEDWFQEEDLEVELRECKRKIKQMQERVKFKLEKVKTAAFGSSLPELPPTQAPYKPIPENICALAIDDIKELLPPGSKISEESVHDTRFKIYADYFPTRSKVFSAGDIQSERSAALFLLRLVWTKWCKISEENCPYDLSD